MWKIALSSSMARSQSQVKEAAWTHGHLPAKKYTTVNFFLNMIIKIFVLRDYEYGLIDGG